ncbi:hypothetical protein DPE81_03875 [Salmonella enterica subsp. enterica]|nr:hypothetical protein [Salmonella enterica subsp. enterica serovar Chittagong]ECI2729562.1 hypothetical protein [Salmonella enterica subsp. enterica]ECI4108136.1 hypothetical protein [Salmonella enterica subsp. enterica]
MRWISRRSVTTPLLPIHRFINRLLVGNIIPDGAALIWPTASRSVGRIRYLCRHPAKSLLVVGIHIQPLTINNDIAPGFGG